jgi:hypothetical protein
MNCITSSNSRRTAPPRTFEPKIFTHNANTFTKPMAHHILIANAKRNRRRNTAKKTQHSHHITTAPATFLAFLITASSFDKRATTASSPTPRHRRPLRRCPTHRGPSTNHGPKQICANNQPTCTTLSHAITQPHLDTNLTLRAQEEEDPPQHDIPHPRCNPHSLTLQTTSTSENNAPEHALTLHNMGTSTRPAGTTNHTAPNFHIAPPPPPPSPHQTPHPKNAF